MGAKAAKIIKAALKIMRKYPDYKFVIESVMAVEYFKLHYPELFEELKRRVREKRIELIGGMVIAPDTVLPNGESLVRQILYGTQYYRHNFGIESKIGYLIDTFGLTPQLPQILKKSDFKYLIFVRGARHRNLPQEFLWKALDGSEILTHLLASSYVYITPPFTGALIPPFYPFFPILGTLGTIPLNFKIYEILKKFLPPIKHIFQRISVINKGVPILDTDLSCGLKYTINKRIQKATTNNVLVLNGMDNTPPSTNIIDAVNYLQKKSNKYNIKLALPSEFLKSVVKSRKKFGIIDKYEFLGYPDKFTGTWSNRIRLKQKIRSLENLFYLAELFATLSNVYADVEYPKEKITNAIWRILCCDFHDAICGCHVDAAYNRIMKMLKLSEIQLRKILKESFEFLTNSIDTSQVPKNATPLVIFNPLSVCRTELASFKAPQNLKDFTLKDDINNQIFYQKDNFSDSNAIYNFIASDIPSIGYKTYYLHDEKSTESLDFKDNFLIKNNDQNQIVQIENKRFLLLFESNKLKSITDKTLNFTFNSSNYYVNDLRIFNDRGDSYLQGKIAKKIYTTFVSKCDIFEKGPVRIVIRISSKLQCKSKRFFKPTNEILQYIILYNTDTPRIDFITKFKNKIRNISIQTCFPVNFDNPKFHSEVPFGYIERDIVPKIGKSWADFKRKFAHYDRIFPVINWMDASNYFQKIGITVINHGLPGYEIGENKDNIFLTLLRSTGYVGNIFPGSVPMVLGPFYSIPQALELTDQEFHYSLFFHDGNINSNQLAMEALRCNIPLITKNLSYKNAKLPNKCSFIKLSPNNFIITSIKKSEVNDKEIIVRVLETSNQPLKGKIILNFSVQKVFLVNLLEKPIIELNVKDNNSFSFDSRAQEILTFCLKI